MSRNDAVSAWDCRRRRKNEKLGPEAVERPSLVSESRPDVEDESLEDEEEEEELLDESPKKARKRAIVSRPEAEELLEELELLEPSFDEDEELLVSRLLAVDARLAELRLARLPARPPERRPPPPSVRRRVDRRCVLRRTRDALT